ncbi:MAG: aspartate/glutamate racemase family protein [Desulfofustis sp.]|nr:aspartate/glutamate racemase family protein [Desulfofustis sp.]NNK56651.1 aspartate/glutamate racemase family protein [Desulfofustis sp.]
MKTVGLIGGMSWESTATYYRLINQGIRNRCGGLHSAKMLLYSVDFAEIEELQSSGRWHEAGQLLAEAAVRLEKGGADLMLICTNTMHKVADQVVAAVTLPLIHIAEATGEKIVRDGIKAVGLLGTRFTMEEKFYRSVLEDRFGLRVVVPPAEDRRLVDEVIFDELCRGVIADESRKEYLRIVESLAAQGCGAVILGCTEIALLIGARDTDLKLYDTTEIHAQQAVTMMLEQ